MPTGRVIDVLSRVAREPDGRCDGDLVAAFVAFRTDGAFAELLRRHGPTVFGVCRRILGHTHDAEDAFQAVFLVLARRAQTIHPPAMVGNWLYGVAVRTALKARTLAAKRRRNGRAGAKNEAVEDVLNPSDERQIIDEELARLAPKYRTVIVLCDLNGQSRSAASQHLGWPEGTVAARLAKARQLLATRLTRRGVTLAAAGVGALLAPDATAAVPVALAAEARGLATGAATVSPLAQSLAEGVMRTMILTKWKFPAALVLACGVTLAALFAASPEAPPPPAGVPANPAPKPPEPKPMEVTWTPRPTLDHTGWLVGSVAFSPDGKQLLVGGTSGHVRAYETAKLAQLWEHKVDGEHAAAVAFSTDGKRIAMTYPDGVRFLDPATGKGDDVIEVEESRPTALAFFLDVTLARGDGTTLASHKVIFGNDRGYFVKSWIAWPKISTITTSTTPPGKQPADSGVPLAVDPDGKRVVVTGPIDRATGKNVLWAWSAGSGASNHLLEGHTTPVIAATWATDGTTLITADAGGTVIRWDAKTFKELSRLTLPGRVAAVAVTADGQRIAAAVVVPSGRKDTDAYSEEVFVWPATKPPEKLAPLGSLLSGGPFVGRAGVAFAPDGKSLAAGFCNFSHLSRLGELIGKVRVWELTPKR